MADSKVYVSNKLCIIERVINPWIIFAKCVISQAIYRIALSDEFSLDSSFIGKSLYFDGEIHEPTKQMMFASCYDRDEKGSVVFIKSKE